ncbi:LPXTG cell wall anchor domain-containing protein [Corynebacterium propinquum]|uniref:DUF6923 family protein n=1 Tax=Corynebacterium propinquum TaxID=43769 RepID=UPI0011A28B7F|nr:LPXTG cell wall anchor domain-containing protein [Corynebacterium propinquum]WKS49723.1 LPXTG cell wall anchor domain-containing protein [Corynebacterium propinquum]
MKYIPRAQCHAAVVIVVALAVLVISFTPGNFGQFARADEESNQPTTQETITGPADETANNTARPAPGLTIPTESATSVTEPIEAIEPSASREMDQTVPERMPHEAPVQDLEEQPQVTVTRNGNVDEVVIEHPVDFYDHLSLDNLVGVIRSGVGEIETVDKAVTDGQEREPVDYALRASAIGDLIIFDGNKLHANPPKRIELTVVAPSGGEYRMAGVDELPTRAELEAEGLFGSENLDFAEGARSAAQCEPLGKQSSSTKELPLSGGGNYERHGTSTLVRISGLRPGDKINSLTIKTSTKLNSGSATIFRNSQGNLTTRSSSATNSEINGQLSASRSEITFALPTFEVGGDGTIEVAVDTGARPKRLFKSAIVGLVTHSEELYDNPPRESDLAKPQAKRDLTREEKTSGTQVYVSTSLNQQGQGSGDLIRTTLNLQEQDSKSFKRIGESGWIYNGLAYDEQDNWLYAVSNEKTGDQQNCFPEAHLLQINPLNGQTRNLGPLRAANGADILAEAGASDRQLLNAGVVYKGHLFVSNSSTSGTRTMYRIPLPSAGRFVAGKPKVEKLNVKFYAEDYAQVKGNPEYAWGLVSREPLRKQQIPEARPSTDQDLVLQRVDLRNGKSRYFKLSDSQRTTLDGSNLKQVTTWGTAWSYGNGNLGFGPGGEARAEKNGVQVRVENPASNDPKIQVVQLLTQIPDSYNTDATSNALALPDVNSDLRVSKTHLAGEIDEKYRAQLYSLQDGVRKTVEQETGTASIEGYHFWAVELTNVGEAASSGSTVYEKLPQVYDPTTGEYRWETFNSAGQKITTPIAELSYQANDPSRGTIQFVFGRLNPGDTVRMYIAARFKDGQSECKPNQVEVLNNDKDETPNDNHDSADCVEEVDSKVGFELHKVDASDIENSVPPKKLSGGQFVLIDGTKEDGSFTQENDINWQAAVHPDNPGAHALVETEESGVYSTEDKLEVGKYYWLLETQSPKDESGKPYNLLTRPILFQLTRDKGNNVQAMFYDSSAHGAEGDSWKTSYPVANMYSDVKSKDKLTIQLANIRQGEMPKTGSFGIWPFVLAGLLTILAGAYLSLRRREA